MALRKRPRPLKEETDITVENLEHSFRYIDDMLIDQDSRRIPVQVALASSETDLAVIVSKLNALIAALNESELTEAS